MARLIIKIIALYLVYQFVVVPVAAELMGRVSGGIRFLHSVYWWMSPAPGGW